MNVTDFVIVRLDPDTGIAPFDCGDTDLNDFLSDDDENEQTRLMYLDIKRFIS